MERTKPVITLLLILFLLLCPLLSTGSPYYGATVSSIIYGKEPALFHGFQLMLVYDPELIQGRQFNVYFDGGFSHLSTSATPYYTTVNIYSIAPVFRYTFCQHWWNIHPFLELSIGLAYLNHTHFDSRNLGMHFTFQDRAGLGVFYGSTKQVSIGIHAMHYSNAHLSGRNSGITAPLVLDIGYRFQ